MGTVGRLLTDYGELEFSLMHCVHVVRDDLDASLKAMFRVRSESSRIDIADALGRGPYHALDLGTQFEMSIAAMRHCLKIRNNYSHCHWHNYDDKLCFLMLEELAVQKQPVTNLDRLTFMFLDDALLDAQEEYFRYTEDCITFINHEGRLRREKLKSNPFPWPGPRKPPDLHI
jgi:hypothetical protein